MHDIDRTQAEGAWETYGLETQEYEYEMEGSGVFNEDQEMELAAGLLEVTDEAELDRFLGDLIKKAGSAIGSFVKGPIGQQLGGLLKGAAKKALPTLGKAVGTYFGGPSGGAIGGQVASTAGRLFGLELEGLSQEDQEFEVARQFVRFAGDAVKNAGQIPPTTPPAAAAQSAVAAAAQKYAPGLLSGAAAPTGATGPGGTRRTGRWIRRGNKIILMGA